MLVIDEQRVHNQLNFKDLISELRCNFSRPATTPQRQVFNLDNTHSDAFAVLPSWNDETIAVKAFTYFPNNPYKENPLASLYSKIMIFDRKTGVPQALVDGTSVTYWRTAAVSALASDYLAKKSSSKLLLLGTGKLAPFMALAHASVRPIKEILIHGRTPAKAENVVKLIQTTRPDLKVGICQDLELAIKNADTVSCVTNSATPLFSGQWVQTGTHIDLVGNHEQNRRECDSELIIKSDVYVDSKINVFAEAGELLIPKSEGVFCFTEVKAELTQLCKKEVLGRHNDEQITLFKSVGTALADLVGAQLIYSNLKKLAYTQNT